MFRRLDGGEKQKRPRTLSWPSRAERTRASPSRWACSAASTRAAMASNSPRAAVRPSASRIARIAPWTPSTSAPVLYSCSTVPPADPSTAISRTRRPARRVGRRPRAELGQGVAVALRGLELGHVVGDLLQLALEARRGDGLAVRPRRPRPGLGGRVAEAPEVVAPASERWLKTSHCGPATAAASSSSRGSVALPRHHARVPRRRTRLPVDDGSPNDARPRRRAESDAAARMARACSTNWRSRRR